MKKTLLFSAALAFAMSASAQVKLTKDNIEEVLKAMTTEEKVDLCVGGGWGSMVAASVPTGSDEKLVPGAAGTTKAIARLGIPATVLSDGPAGLRINPTRPGTTKTYYCTGFPVGTVLACSWDTEMVENLLKAMGNEVLEYGADVLLAPGQNIHRNPLCGRNFEYFSEDPILSGKMAAAYVRGIQSQGVGVSVKHFAFNNQEVNRNANIAQVNQRAARELYLRNFEISVKESDPWTVMSSYNQVNGEYTQQSHDLLTTILRDEWGFKGIVMTDWGNKEGTVKAVHAQNDLMEPGSPNENERILKALKDGSLKMEDLDRNVRNMLNYIVRTPRFNHYKYSDNPDLTGHAKLVREAATQGMVLLKNKANALPMKDVKNVALFGATAYNSIAGGTGSGNVNKPYIRNIDEGLTAAGLTLDAQLATYYKEYLQAEKAKTAINAAGRGFGIMLGDAVIPDPAIEKQAIKNSVTRNDAAVIVIGRNAGEGDDRRIEDDWNLSAAETALINQVCNIYHQEGKKVYVVLNIGGVIETASWKSLPDGILLAWTPGQEVGNSVADILTGKANPSGKLSMTFPMTIFDHPSTFNFPYEGRQQAQQGRGFFMGGPQKPQPVKNQDYTDYAEGIWVGYRYFNTADVEVSYPFGFGLSYTNFAYSTPVVKVGKDGGITATITVKNTGDVAGREAVQLYVTAPDGGMVKPESELKAFAKTKELQPGESQTLTMSCSPYYLSSFNEGASQWETAAGKYTVKFGANAQDIRATGSVVLKGQNWKTNNALAPTAPVQEMSFVK
ncbi:MAG: glycoside hydrolase family 3 C-terminal domain-containing protein [Bacteroidaceae bacterium]|nr:glycoside hydrolase family 3 C-terminal domain-containing protein [Bacteroidaceae bacterium]